LIKEFASPKKIDGKTERQLAITNRQIKYYSLNPPPLMSHWLDWKYNIIFSFILITTIIQSDHTTTNITERSSELDRKGNLTSAS